MIQVENLSKCYGKEQVLQQLNITFLPGRIYGLIGINGCGKTTLLRCICGFARPTGGRVTVQGKVIGRDVDFAPHTGMMIENPGFLPHYSGFQNLCILAGVSGGANWQRIREVLALAGLSAQADKRVGQYSLGMRQRLGIAQAILENPDALLLDEPFSALDKDGVWDMTRLLLEMRAQGKTILIASHEMAYLRPLCDEAYEMCRGVLHRLEGL